MINLQKKCNFNGIAELGEGHGYFILPTTEDLDKGLR